MNFVLNFRRNGKNVLIGTGRNASRLIPLATVSAPSASVAIPDQIFTQGTGNRTLNLTNYFSGTGLTFGLQSPVTGVSISGDILTISDASVLASANVTVSAGNAYGASVSQTFARQVVASGPATLAVTDFSRDMLVYDSGAAVGLSSATVPISGTGTIGEVIEARAFSLDDNGASSSAWVVVDTVSVAGTWIGSITPSLSRSWYRVEVRYQATPGTVVSTTNKFAVGYVLANWGQSESARGWDTTFNDCPTPALVTLKEQIANLKQPGMSGRTSRNALKVIGVDTLPVGATISGNIITLTGTGVFEDWYVPDARVDVANGAFWTVRHNKFEEVTENVTPNYQLYIRLGGLASVEENDFLGMQFATGLACAVKTEENGTNYGTAHVYRNRMYGLPADGVKIVSGSIRWNYMGWKKNLDQIPTTWSAAVSYNAGDHVWNSTGNAYVSKASGNLNNQPPAGKVTNDPNWTLVDPHVDCITVEKAFTRVDVEYNYLDLAEGTAANGGVGMNNYIRYQPNNATAGFLDKVYTRFNLCDKDASAGSHAFQITTDFLADVEFYGNWIYPNNAGNPNYPFTVGQTSQITWGGNRHIDTDATFTTPSNCTAISFTDETTDNVVQHIFNNRLPTIGNGAVQHKFMTAASRYTPSFAAMANVALMELVGHKVVFLHHTVSGTGFNELFNDASTAKRMWSDEQSMHDYATADGVNVGMAYQSWYASNTGIKNNFGHAAFELASKTTWGTQTPITVTPYNYPSTNTSWNADHFWADIYDYSRTRWVILGPHMRPADQMMLNSTRTLAGARQFTQENYALLRQSIRSQMADPRVDPYFKPPGLEPHNWETGYLSNPSIIDWLHPSADTIDGLAQYLTLLVHGALQAAGIRKWVVPEFDQVFWAADGSYVEVWSSQGDITTTRLQRGLPSMGTTHPHWTDCFAWEWKVGVPNWGGDGNLVPIESATIVAADGSGTPATAGRVRILKPAAGTWASGDSIAFGGGAGAGVLVHPDDLNNQAWLNQPVVMVGAYGADGNQVGMSLKRATYFTRP